MPILVLACGQSLAQEVGLVISSVAIIQQVAVPRQVCITEAVAVQAPKSGAGAVLGALAGVLLVMPSGLVAAAQRPPCWAFLAVP